MSAPVATGRGVPRAGVVSPLASVFGGALASVRTAAPVAALTFDDGPHPEFTPLLLALLARHDARATFFLVGQSAAGQRALVEEMAGCGHEVGNHSWDHPSFTRVGGGERRRQLRRCRDALAPIAMRWFRPPYGEHSFAARLDAARCGLDSVRWSLDVQDWCETDETVLAEGLARGIKPGSIVLLHDAISGKPGFGPALARPVVHDRSATLAALERVLVRLRGRVHFVTLSDLLAAGSAVRHR